MITRSGNCSALWLSSYLPQVTLPHRAVTTLSRLGDEAQRRHGKARASMNRGKTPFDLAKTKEIFAAFTVKASFIAFSKNCRNCHETFRTKMKLNKPAAPRGRPPRAAYCHIHAVRNSITDLLNWRGSCSIAK
jgi:hypothetical protein